MQMIPAPDPGWLPFLKLGLVLVIVLSLSMMGLCVALGKVEMNTSYGFGEIIGVFSTLGGGAAGWAFGNNKKQDGDKD